MNTIMIPVSRFFTIVVVMVMTSSCNQSSFENKEANSITNSEQTVATTKSFIPAVKDSTHTISSSSRTPSCCVGAPSRFAFKPKPAR